MLAKRLRLTLLSSTILLLASSQAFSAEKIIRNFSGRDGINPSGGLLIDGAGAFYGSALDGTVFKFSPDGAGGWAYTVLCHCQTTYAYGSLVMDKSGNLYGSTFWGEIYQYSPGAPGSWSAKRIYLFDGESGNGPSPLVIDAEGNLFGSYASGGTHGMGYVFQLTRGAGGAWSMTHVHDFAGTDGQVTAENNAYTLVGGLVIDSAGNLYGTAGQGGSSQKCSGGCGVVFELTKSSGNWVEKILHSFNGTDGINPDATLLIDDAGNLYGTTTDGGAHGFGAVFKLTAGTWQAKNLYSFKGVSGDGAYPNSPLVMDAGGNIFGTTESGGGSIHCDVVNDVGCGTVFELKNNGGTYTESVLAKFSGQGNGGFPGGVIFGADGNLYGIAEVGGANNKGLFFQIPQ
jgi:uncharacterized repeat protein (TIGR03803 family)